MRVLSVPSVLNSFFGLDLIRFSAVVFRELQVGVESTGRRGADKAKKIEAWVDDLAITQQIVPVDEISFCECARMMDAKTPELLKDAMICGNREGLWIYGRDAQRTRLQALQRPNSKSVSPRLVLARFGSVRVLAVSFEPPLRISLRRHQLAPLWNSGPREIHARPWPRPRP